MKRHLHSCRLLSIYTASFSFHFLLSLSLSLFFLLSFFSYDPTRRVIRFGHFCAICNTFRDCLQTQFRIFRLRSLPYQRQKFCLHRWCWNIIVYLRFPHAPCTNVRYLQSSRGLKISRSNTDNGCQCLAATELPERFAVAALALFTLPNL